jgi:hypothetical protein
LIDDAARAIQLRSVAELEEALARYVRACSEEEPYDPRDVMVGLAPFFDAAMRLEADPGAIFSRVAEAATGDLADLVRRFGARSDVTLDAFGWAFQRGDPPRYIPKP